MSDNHPAITDDSAPKRIDSIDVFRALTMMVMVFVNDLDTAGNSLIQNVPPRLGHGDGSNLIALADTVFPAFLFITGMAIPLAIERRREKGIPNLQIWKHIFLRTIGLMIIGISMGNMRVFYWNGAESRYALGGMNMHLWCVLLYVSFILIWNRYPISNGLKRVIYLALRFCGIALLACLIFIYRKGTPGDDNQPFLDPAWWAPNRYPNWYVLGKLGWAYLVCCGAYFVFRKHIAGMVGFLAMLLLLTTRKSGVFAGFGFLDPIGSYVSLDMIVGVSMYTSAGVIIGMLFQQYSPAKTPKKRIIWILVFAAASYAAFLLHGTGEFQMLAISSTAYLLLYIFIDICRIKRWAGFLLPVGRNVILLYFISMAAHPLLYAMGIHSINDYFNSGIIGIVRTVLYTVILTLMVSLLTTRCRMKLRL